MRKYKAMGIDPPTDGSETPPDSYTKTRTSVSSHYIAHLNTCRQQGHTSTKIIEKSIKKIGIFLLLIFILSNGLTSLFDSIDFEVTSTKNTKALNHQHAGELKDANKAVELLNQQEQGLTEKRDARIREINSFIDICKKNQDKNFKDLCLLGYAKSGEMPELCDYILTGSVRTQCREHGNEDKTITFPLSSPKPELTAEEKEAELNKQKEQTLNEKEEELRLKVKTVMEACGDNVNNQNKDLCILTHAKSGQDPVVCGLMSSTEKIKACLDELKSMSR